MDYNKFNFWLLYLIKIMNFLINITHYNLIEIKKISWLLIVNLYKINIKMLLIHYNVMYNSNSNNNNLFDLTQWL